MLYRIPGDIHFHRVSIGNIHHRDKCSAWRFTDLWVFHGNGKGIRGIRVVDHQKVAYRCRVYGPESNFFAVRRPAETVTATEFLLIGPVKCTMDNPVAAGLR